METIELNIPTMKSPHCQMTVTNAVQALGASVKSIAPARAEIGLNGHSREEVIAVIERAGYLVVNK